MITPESLKRLAKMQGYPDDVDLAFDEPTSGNDFAHILRISRASTSAALEKKFLFGAPSLGEIARVLSSLLLEHRWLQ